MRLILSDATRKKSLLDEGWMFGSLWSWLWEGADGVLGAISWEEAIRWFISRGMVHKITEIEIWGHGSPGEVWINSERLTDHLDDFYDIEPFLAPECLIWFRTCAAFHGETGIKFAKELVEHMNCRFAGHTYNIGFPFHSGLHSIKHGQEVSWDAKEGFGKKGRKWSGMFEPNTIRTFSTTVPRGW